MQDILWIDDDEFLFSPYRIHFYDEGFNLETASNAAEGLRKLQVRRFDIVIVDMAMPTGEWDPPGEVKGGLDTGVILAKVIRKKHKDIRVICYSIHYSADAKELLDDSGVEYISKASYPGKKLIEYIKQGPSQNEENLLTKTYNALELKPRIFGIGVDLKKIFRRT
jgi:DNA-binding NtrC family response regulator